jgi:hypothetical protein
MPSSLEQAVMKGREAAANRPGSFEAFFSGGLDFSELGGATTRTQQQPQQPSNAATLLKLKQQEAREKQYELEEEGRMQVAVRHRVEAFKKYGSTATENALRQLNGETTTQGDKANRMMFSALIDMHGTDLKVLDARDRKNHPKKRRLGSSCDDKQQQQNHLGGPNKARAVKKSKRVKL